MRQVNQPAFSQLTRLFVLVRYGNFEASEDIFQQMKSQQDAIMGKGGDSL
jgi:pentatricopeptide repeat protein